jgi:hypothetical protein
MNENHNIKLDNDWIDEYQKDADLADADLVDTDLVDTDLADADLADADLKNVSNMKLDLFYKDCVKYINIIFVYLETKNNECSIVYVKKNKHNIIKSLCESDISNLTVNNKTFQNNTYRVKTILQYNFTIHPDDLLTDEKNVLVGDNYLYEHSAHSTIHFNESIKLFENLNSLYFIMEKPKSNVKTRKLYLKSKFKNNKTRRRNENNRENTDNNNKN